MKVNLMSAQDLRLHMNWHIFVFIVEIVIILKMMFFLGPSLPIGWKKKQTDLLVNY